MTRRWRWRIGIAIGLIAASPLVVALPILVVVGLATACSVNEGGTTPCIVGGVDIGEPLLALGLFAAWGVLLTGPIALCLLALWGAVELGLWLGRRRASRRSTRPPPPDP